MKNVLVQYQGGGYDGCIWEWNFFWIDKQGKFHNIFSSGYKGIDTQEQAFELLKEDGLYVYHFDNPDDLQAFATEIHSGLVRMVVEYFDENEHDLNPNELPYCICEVCGAECFLDDIVETDSGLICNQCYYMGICEQCGEYYGEEFLHKVNPKRYGDCEYLCAYCKENIEEGEDMLSDNELEDLFFQAMCTGTPDIFDEQFNCYWG